MKTFLKESIPLSEKAAFNVGEGAAILGLSRQTLYNEINSGRLKSFKVGRRRVIPSEAISAWKQAMLEGAA